MKLICTYPHPEHPERRVEAKIPLQSVSVTGTAVDSFARVTIAQVYENSTAHPLEAVFKMPIDEQSAVCGFEAVVDGKTVVGVVQEKSKAFETYDKAISEGHGAYLAEEERADVFTISVGNLPAGKSVEVRITYLTKLVSEGDDLRFTLPATIGERYTPASSKDEDAVDTSDAAVVAPPTSASARYPIKVRLDLRMTAALRSVTSPSHPISFELGEDTGTGVVTLARDEPMDAEVVFVIATRDPHRPTACCEISPSPASSSEQQQATAMVSLFPSFGADALSAENGSLYFLVDRSGSMGGSKMEQCKNALQIFLRSLPEGAKFNIVSFGSSHKEMFPNGCKALDDDTLESASDEVAVMSANMGGTEILAPLKAIIARAGKPQGGGGGSKQKEGGGGFLSGFFRRRSRGKSASSGDGSGEGEGAAPIAPQDVIQVVVLTDGQVSNTQAVLETVGAAAASGTCRFFSLGIGNGASHELVAGIARRGRGVAEFVADGERMEAKVMRQLRRATKPALEDAKIEWLRDGKPLAEVEMCPEELPPVFSGDRFTAFAQFPAGGVVPDAARLTGRSMEGPLDTTLTIPEDAVREGGDLLSVLAARETIRHLQETQGDKAKARIIEIATKRGIASRYTSFVAVEKRDELVDSTDMELVIVPQAAPRRPQPPQPQRSMMMMARCAAPMAMSMPMGGGGGGPPGGMQMCGAAPPPPSGAVKSRKKKGGLFGSSSSSSSSKSSARCRDAAPERKMAEMACEESCAPMMPMEMDEDDCDDGAAEGFALPTNSAAPSMAMPPPPAPSAQAPPPPPSGPSPPDARPDAILRCQKADGRWEISEKLCAAIAGATGQAIAGTTLGDGGKEGASTVWATALAIAALRTRYKAMKEEWAMIESKGVAWLTKRLGTGEKVEDVINAAIKMLGEADKVGEIAATVSF